MFYLATIREWMPGLALAMFAMESWLFSLTTTDYYYSLFMFVLCAMVLHRCGLLFRNIFILKSQAISYVDMLSETEFADISRTSIQTQTENLIWKPYEKAVASSESNKLKIKRINDELIRVQQHINELKSHAHCFQSPDTRQNEIFNSEILKCERIMIELELQKKKLSLEGHEDQLDLLQNELGTVSEEDKQLINTLYSKESLHEYILEKKQNKFLVNTQQFSGVLEEIIPELEKFQFKLQKLNETDAWFSLYGQNQPIERHNSYFRHCHGIPHEKESRPCSYDNIQKQMLSKTDTNIAECTDSGVKNTNCCLKHFYEEKKIAMEIKQEKAKAERELQKFLCRRDRTKFNYDKAKCMVKREAAALALYYQYFNQAQEALRLREGTCRQFSDTVVKKGYEMLKEQYYRSQQHVTQLDKDLTVHYEEVMAAHNVLEILEKHAVNFFERQELLHSQEFYLVDKMILLQELIEYVVREEQRLSYFLREVNESKKKMAAMVTAMDNIEVQARSLKNSDIEKVRAELMKVVKQMQYAKCLDSCRALKDSEHLIFCMTEKISLKPSQLDQLRLKGEVESILKKCQDWGQREKIMYIEQLQELEKITASQYISEEQCVGTVKDVHQKVSDTSEKEERKEAMNMSATEIKDHSGNGQKAVNATGDANTKSLDDQTCALGSAV